MKNINLNIMRNVLFEEAKAIEKLADSLDDRMEELVKRCSECEGKIVLTGMGKSGHVAKKISATLASLGTPSFYLHPAEAAHGDLGMLEKRDLVIMISKSGETDELLQLISSLKVIGCELIGMFCKENSSLQKYCDFTVVIPVDKEACVNNLAPTTSTTVTMALGDALAIELSELKGFQKQSFAVFHPQGTLGKQLLLTVGRIASSDLKDISVQPSDEIKTVLWCITRNRLGAVAVVDQDGTLKGLISDGDIRRAIEKEENIMTLQAAAIMTYSPVAVREDALAADVFKVMQQKKISVVPIVNDENKLINMISFHDIVKNGITG